MEHYATFLRVDYAKAYTVELRDLFAPSVQRNVLNTVLCGHGRNSEVALTDALRFLLDSGILFSCECEPKAINIIETKDCLDTLMHLYFETNEKGKLRLMALPKRDGSAIEKFCEQYKLPKKARNELLLAFQSLLSQPFVNITKISQEDKMTTGKRNSHGLFDAPVRSTEKERVTLTEADIERQLDAGAFFMDRDEAIKAGFINPQNEPDTVIIDVRREDV